MLDRLLSIQPQEFHRKIVPFVNDVTVGWDISEISKSEVSEFMTIVIKKLAEQDIAIPEQIWNSWMYVLGFDDDKGRFKSLKDFGKMNIENRMESVEKLLDESKDLILGFQDKEHIDGLYCFLLDSTRNCSDVYLLLNRYISLPSRLCGRNAWHKFLAKLLYYKDSSIDLVLDLVYRMMVLENVIPTTELILMLKKYMLKNQTRGLSPSGADILNRLDSKNELYNVMLVGLVDSCQFDKLMSFIGYMDKIGQKPFYYPMGHVIKKLFGARKYIYGFQLIQRYFDDLVNPKVLPGMHPRLYEDIMIALSQGKFYHYVHHLFIHSRKYGLERSPTMSNILLASYLKRGNIDKALETAQYLQNKGGRMSSDSSRQFVIALNKRNPVEAQEFLNGLFQSGSMDIVLYKTAIQNDLTLPGLATPQEIFVHMIQNGIQPDRMFFMVWMKRIHQNQRNLVDVVDLFELSKEYFSPNLHTFNFMIKVYLDHSLLDEANAMYTKMLHDRILPDRYTHTTYMVAFLKQNEYEKALPYYGKMIGYDFTTKKVIQVSPRERAGGDVIETMLRYSVDKSKLLYITMRCGLRPTIPGLFTLLCELLPKHPWSSALIPMMNQERYQTLLLEKCLDRKWDFKIRSVHREMLQKWSLLDWDQVHNDLIQKVKLGHAFDEYLLYRSISKRLNVEIPHQIDSAVKHEIDDFLNRFFNMQVPEAIPTWNRPRMEYLAVVKTSKPDLDYQEDIADLAKPFVEPKKIPRVETVSKIASDILPVLHTAVAIYRDIKRKK